MPTGAKTCLLYTSPAPGADPVRAGAAALPSGRNIHSIDPWRLPSEVALQRGQDMTERLLAQHVACLLYTSRCV